MITIRANPPAAPAPMIKAGFWLFSVSVHGEKNLNLDNQISLKTVNNEEKAIIEGLFKLELKLALVSNKAHAIILILYQI